MILYAPYKYTLKGNSGSKALIQNLSSNDCCLVAAINLSISIGSVVPSADVNGALVFTR